MHRVRHGPLAREAWLPAPGGDRIRAAAVQTFTRGTESAAIAYRGLVQVQDGAEAGLLPGQFVDVRIMGADEHDLFGLVEAVVDDAPAERADPLRVLLQS